MHNYNDPNDYQRTVIRMVFGLLLILLLLAYGTSCRTPKTSLVQKEAIIDISKSDSTSLTTINRAIDDKTVITLPAVKTADPNCDSICQLAVNDAMSLASFYKQSGENRYQLLYDQHARTLTLLTTMGATKNQETRTNKERNYTTTLEIVKTVTVTVVPGWARTMALVAGMIIGLAIIWITLKIRSKWLTKLSTT